MHYEKNTLIDHKGKDRCLVIDSESYYPFLNCTYALVNNWNYKTIILVEYKNEMERTEDDIFKIIEKNMGVLHTGMFNISQTNRK